MEQTDAIYGYSIEDPDAILWVNDNLIECMAWNELPELQHESIKLSSELDIYYPSWADAITLPNNINKEQLFEIIEKHYEEND